MFIFFYIKFLKTLQNKTMCIIFIIENAFWRLVLRRLYCTFGFRTPEASNAEHAAAAEESAGSFLAKAIHSMEENVNGTVNIENNTMPEAGDFTESGNFIVAQFIHPSC